MFVKLWKGRRHFGTEIPDVSRTALVLRQGQEEELVIPAQAGTQNVENWISACAGMTINTKTKV